MMKRYILECAAVLMCAGQAAAVSWDDIVAALPDASTEAITNGIFFWQGEYVPPPYVVTRHGVGVFVNGHHIWNFATNPFPGMSSLSALEQDARPSVPSGIVASTSIESPLCKEYIERASVYWVSSKENGSLSDLVDAVRSLPNVGEVNVWDGTIEIVSKSASERIQFRPLARRGGDSWRYYTYSLAKQGKLEDKGCEDMEFFADEFRQGKFVYIGPGGILSGHGYGDKFKVILPLIDKGLADDEIVAVNDKGDAYGGEIFFPPMLATLLKHRESLLNTDFRRRMFGEYWQTYGVKPETEEERVERLYRGVTYEERTAESFSNRLESLEYNTKLRYGAETNKWPETDIESVDRFRREYAEHVAERDAAWAALSDADRAIVRARIDKEKSDAEAEKQRKLRVEAEAEIARLYTKIFSRIKDDFSSDFSVERIEEIAHETAQEEYVFSALAAYYSMKGVFPSDLSVLISYVYQGDLLLFDGARYTVDQWGRSYRYTRFMDRQLPSARLTSAGPDGKFDTEDDITTTRRSWAANLR